MTSALPFRAYTSKHLEAIPQLEHLDADARATLRAVAAVLPFRVNGHVLDLIDWDRVPDDPIYQLTFPQPGMLEPADLERVRELIRANAPPDELRSVVRGIQMRLNPHPGAQRELNRPRVEGRPLEGVQHKYRETVLFFPAQGQTCHAYCSYCFRWAQFVGIDELKIQARHTERLVRYLEAHPEATDVLLTGGDPMVMTARALARVIEPLLAIPTVRTLRIGTKAPAYWPQRFVSDPDADDVLRLFERVVDAGKHLAVMAHYSHPRELEPPIARRAVERIRDTGAVVRSQAPLIRHVNDDPRTWAALWNAQVLLGVVPYYFFVERNTGAKRYFEVTLDRALRIHRAATARVSGLGRTARGPTMSCTPGKVVVRDVAEVAGKIVFVLEMIQGRDPSWAGRVFFARHDPTATWITDLEPAFTDRFFFRPLPTAESTHSEPPAASVLP